MTGYVVAFAIALGLSLTAVSASAGGGCMKNKQQMTVQSSTPSTVVDGAQTVPMTPPPAAPGTGG